MGGAGRCVSRSLSSAWPRTREGPSRRKATCRDVIRILALGVKTDRLPLIRRLVPVARLPRPISGVNSQTTAGRCCHEELGLFFARWDWSTPATYVGSAAGCAKA